jgi:ribosomal protein L16 Arg81 hydroxylase
MIIDFRISNIEFTDLYQEKRPLLLKGAILPITFDWHDANEIFERSDVASDDFKLSYEGIVPKHEYVERYVDIGTLRHRLIKPAVYDYLRKGATLIANKIANEPMVSALARQISLFTGRQVVSSAYAAFGTKDSFRAHWDTRDVFAIQLIGRKRWIVYEPSLDSPLYMQQSKDHEDRYPCPEEPYMDFVLEAGDVFYLPRGWWHNPLPLDEETFHLAIGTFPAYAIDYAQWALQQLPNLVEARRSLQAWEHDRETLASLGSHLDALLNDPDSYRRFMDEFVGATRVESRLAIEVFGNSNARPIPDDAGIRLSVGRAHGLLENYVIANGTRLHMDETGSRLIRCVAESPGIPLSRLIAGLPDIDADRIRSLVHRLCHQDVLELVRH